MPELPEVETTVRGLQAKVLNRTFVSIWTDWPKIVKFPRKFSLFAKRLNGQKIVRVWRRAKNVVFDLSSGDSLLIHQKMTGHLLVGKWKMISGIWKAVEAGPLRDSVNGFIHLVFTLDNGAMIALSDMRKFAKVELQKKEEMLQVFEILGPEPLESSFTFKKFQALFKNKRGKVKQVIMDPSFIAGIGNIYASEALWEAKIHPFKDVATLSPKELQVLYKAIKKVLKLGVKFGGDSFSDYRDVNGEKGKFEGAKKAYQREGEPCYRCKTQIKRLVLVQRSSFFCPRCQNL